MSQPNLLYSRAMETPLRHALERHARFSKAIQSFFEDRGYLPVDTPTLSPFLIPEPSIQVFATEYVPGTGPSRPLWLIPSPELWMKRLLAEGSGNIFQVSRSFRNGDFGGPYHNPEFRLLEWYTNDSGYIESIATTEALFSALLPLAATGEIRSRLAPPFIRMTMQEAFLRCAGIDLAACQEVGALRQAAERQGIRLPDQTTWEEAFHVAFLTRVEPALPSDRPVALIDYPALVPTTARGIPGTPWAERWELYVHGVEIANCYTEQTDPGALEDLFRHEEKRMKGVRNPPEQDLALINAFPPGFPPCSGVALGMDRLEMVFHGESSLEGVILFPFSAILRRQSGRDD
jgi:lysyl-tRNA synthetase class 2